MQIEKTFMLVITDLDGTFLDHETYSWAEASEAKEMLASRHIPLVMCSSKTVSEIQTFRASLEINYPFIVENGGAVYLPPKSDQDADWNCIALGKNRGEILAVLSDARRSGFSFKSFQDMSVKDVMEATGLDQDSARQAMQRDFTEPLLWLDGDDRLPAFSKYIKSRGLTMVSGGRFIHVSAGCDKGNALYCLKKYYEQEFGTLPTVIALGDSSNDVSMLEAADRAVVVKSAVQDYPQVNHKQVIYTEKTGPAGWNAAIKQILFEER